MSFELKSRQSMPMHMEGRSSLDQYRSFELWVLYILGNHFGTFIFRPLGPLIMVLKR